MAIVTPESALGELDEIATKVQSLRMSLLIDTVRRRIHELERALARKEER